MRFDSSRRRRDRPFGGRASTGTPVPRRLLTMVLLLGLVMVLMNRAKDPNSWNWFTGPPPPARPGAKDARDGEIDTRVTLEPDGDGKEGVILAEAPGGAASVEKDAASAAKHPYFPGVIPDYFAAVRDNTPYRSAEEDAWCQLVQLMARTDQAKFEAASRGHATFRQLYQQPAFYRGQLITLSGVARRAEKMKIPKNSYHVEGDLYRLWLWPQGSANPVVVESLELPPEFPIGETIEQKVEVTGFFFKIWVYKAKDGLRLAPMLLAKLPRWNESRVARGQLVLDPRPAQDERDPDKPSQPTAREWLKRNRDLDDAFFANFRDGTPIAAPTEKLDDEPAALVKLLYHVPALPRIDIMHWSRESPTWDELRTAAETNRGRLVRLEGKLARVDRVDLPKALAQKFEMAHFYRAEIRPTGGTPAVIFLRSIANEWNLGVPLDDNLGQVFGTALFVKSVSQDDGPSQLVFAGERLGWRRNTLLGDLGVDESLLDFVVNRQEIRRDERDLFFQMLAAAGRMPAEELESQARERQLAQQAKQPVRPKYAEGPANSFVMRDVISTPRENFGQLATLNGQALRATRVAVEDAGERTLFGFDHYYLIDVLVDLDPPLQTKSETGEQLNRNTYPAVFAVRALPDGFEEGDEINERVRVAGFFFKLWRAPLLQGEKPSVARERGSPMFIGHELTWYPRETRVADPWPSIVASALIVALAVALTVAYFFIRRIDRRREREARAIRLDPDPGGLEELENAIATPSAPESSSGGAEVPTIRVQD